GGGRRLEPLDIDLNLVARKERDHPTAEPHGVRVSDRLPRVMRRLAEVGGARIRIEMPPERVDHLVSQATAALAQRKQLHEFGRPAAGPPVVGDRVAVEHYPEPGQELDAYLRRHDTSNDRRFYGAGRRWAAARSRRSGGSVRPGEVSDESLLVLGVGHRTVG